MHTHIRANTHLLACLCGQRNTELLALFPFLSKPCSFSSVSHFLSSSHQGNPWKHPCCFSPSHLYLVNHQSTLVGLFRFHLESFLSEHVPIVLIQSTTASCLMKAACNYRSWLPLCSVSVPSAHCSQPRWLNRKTQVSSKPPHGFPVSWEQNAKVPTMPKRPYTVWPHPLWPHLVPSVLPFNQPPFQTLQGIAFWGRPWSQFF